MTHPKAALDEEDESAGEGGTLTQDCQDILAGHIAGIHHQLHHPEQSFNTNGQLADRYRDMRFLYIWSLLIRCAHNSMVHQTIASKKPAFPFFFGQNKKTFLIFIRGKNYFYSAADLKWAQFKSAAE